jgi:hypothetical protein
VTPGAYDPNPNDLFVLRMPVEVPGLRRYGDPTNACRTRSGPRQTSYVLADPVAGSNDFGFACWAAPPNSLGALLLGVQGRPQGWPVLGVTLWLDPLPMAPCSVSSDAAGVGSFSVPLPANVTGGRFYAQFVWLNTNFCGGFGTLSASDALEVTVR